MRKFAGIAGAVAVAAVTAVVALAAFSGGSSAAPGDGTGAGLREPLVPASLVAIAIGQVVEEGGETATIDLHGSIRDGRAGGNFRFYSEEYGYYNGGVKTLKVEDGVITATGGGGLFPPERRKGPGPVHGGDLDGGQPRRSYGQGQEPAVHHRRDA